MIKLFFVGDIIYHKESKEELLSQQLKKVINEHDIRCCNLEAPIADDNILKSEKIGPVHYQKTQDVKTIIESGFNMFSLANNHIMDYGKEGLKKTLEILNDEITIGAGMNEKEVYSTYTYIKDNLKVGFISVAENGFGACVEKSEYGYAWMNYVKVEKIIKELKKECNYIVMNVHAGAELFEYPLPEIRILYKKFIDLGADFIIGHHPHIIQGFEEYNNGVIFYSLGNFIFSTTNREECKKSYCVSIEIDEKGYKYQIIPVLFDKGQVKLEDYEKEITKINKLSKELIEDENYYNKIDEFCTKLYNNTYKNYYLSVFNIARDNLFNKIKSCIKLLFNVRKDNELLLYHNLAIETHRWICIRALKTINKL